MDFICGVDEVGRGPWAGPVYAAAVILHPEHEIMGLKDSKALSPAKRETLARQIHQQALSCHIAWSTVEDVDALNILGATLLAMQRAIEGLVLKPTLVLVDGLATPKVTMPCQAIVGGDCSHAVISAASIIAKVARDAFMAEQHLRYPVYGFDRHKGYGTYAHRLALEQHGPCPLHRRSFRPVKERIERTTSI